MIGYQTTSNHFSHCTMFAAAGTSARYGLIMDTAICAVSIIILQLLGVLLLVL